MHVDGFRIDLAATLARELHDVDRLSSFFDLVQPRVIERLAEIGFSQSYTYFTWRTTGPEPPMRRSWRTVRRRLLAAKPVAEQT